LSDDDRRLSGSAADAASATFMFADIAGYTALTEAHGDEQAADLVAEFFDAVSEELPTWGGTNVKTIGDALMLRIPEPAQAVLLGLRITHELLRGHGAPAVRVGLHHGPAIERDGDYFGAAVNLAARVAAVATGGEVLLTSHTAALHRRSKASSTNPEAARRCETSVSRWNCSPPFLKARRSTASFPSTRSAKWP
jgi:class 3 adenylate cyclase